LSVLVVVAHPDDEVLGCGATGAALAAAGHRVQMCALSGGVAARSGRVPDEELLANIESAQRELGFERPILGDFPNIQLNTVPHIELVRFIERAIVDSQANVLFTHHPNDLNDDHLQTSRACQAASRLFQRRAGGPRLKRVYFMEVLSSTDWALGPDAPFRPDTFVDASSHFDRKLSALRCYKGVMRPAPHPRSEEVLRALATYRGGQSGLPCAEAFETAIAICDAGSLSAT